MIARLATPRAIVALFLTMVWLSGVFGFRSKRLGELAGTDVTIIDGAFFSTPAKLHALVASYGDAGRALYRTSELTLDLLFPVVYGLFFVLALAWAVPRGLSPTPGRRALWLPIVAAVADLCENVGIAILLSVFPARQPVVEAITTIATPVKFLALISSLGLLVLALVCWFRKAPAPAALR